MTTPAPARSAEERRRDTLHLLEQEVDAWVATADPASGAPYLIPLSYLWDGATLLFSTPAASPTARNLRATAQVRIGLGQTRDVVLIEGNVEVLAASAISPELGDAFAARTGFDPRELTSDYLYFRVRPGRIQAWREANELAGRTLMRNGEWVVAG
jgi:hypothetical protein